jgi:flagellar motor switch protein FliN/FliY
MPDEQKPDSSWEEELLSDSGAAAGPDAETPQSGPQNSEAAGSAGAAVGVESNPADGFKPVTNASDVPEQDAEAAMLAMLEEEENDKSAGRKTIAADEFPDLSGVRMERPVANPADFHQLTPSSGAAVNRSNIDLLLDVKMPVAIELGRTEMAISEILGLGPGSVVELNKLAGEPVDLLVNNKVIARGEVVVVDENFGVRITLLMSPQERLKSLAQD